MFAWNGSYILKVDKNKIIICTLLIIVIISLWLLYNRLNVFVREIDTQHPLVHASGHRHTPPHPPFTRLCL